MQSEKDREIAALRKRLEYAQDVAHLWKTLARHFRDFYLLTYGQAKRNQLRWHKAARERDKLLQKEREDAN